MLSLSQIARRIRRIWLPLPYGDEPQEITIDLRGVSSRDEFQQKLSKHFSIDWDHSERGDSFYHALTNLNGPRTLHFLGWTDFEHRMPRYARSLKRLLLHAQEVWGTVGGVQLLTIKWN
jgi:RNAse (barnase) inhibitor barstar